MSYTGELQENTLLRHGRGTTNTVTNISSMKGSGKTEKNTEQAYLRQEMGPHTKVIFTKGDPRGWIEAMARWLYIQWSI